jgi:glycosyltransferase involved in cell wall biosynthesis
MKKRKILFLINDLLPGGAQRVVLDIASHIDPELHEPVVVALRSSAILQGGRESLDQEFSRKGVKTMNLGWHGHPSIQGFLNLIRLIREESPDVIHAHLPYAVILGAVAGKLAGARQIIAHEHNTREFDPFLIRFLRRAVSPFINLSICYTDEVESSIFGAVHMYMSSSDDHCLAAGARSITVFNGIDTADVATRARGIDKEKIRSSLGVRGGETLVLAVGRLISWKGHEHLIRSFSHVVLHRKDIKLRIVGYGPLESELQNCIRVMNLSDHVELIGSRSDAVELMAAADIFSNVYTYDQQTTVREAAGLAGLEALATGTPVIMGDYPSTRRIAPNGIAVVVDPRSEDSLAQAIEALADAPEERDRIGHAAAHFMQEAMDVRKVARRYEQVYAWLCTDS